MPILSLPSSATQLPEPKMVRVREGHCCGNPAVCIHAGTEVTALAENHCGLGDQVLIEAPQVGRLWVPKNIVEDTG